MLTCREACWYWQCDRQSRAITIQCNLQSYERYSTSMISKSELQVLLIFFERSNIYLIPLGSICLLLCSHIPVKWNTAQARLVVTKVHRDNNVLICREADISHFAIHHREHIIHHLLSHYRVCSNSQILLYNTLHWTSKRHLSFEVSRRAIAIDNSKLSNIVARSDQVIPLYFIDVFLSCSEIILLLQLQLSSTCAVKTCYDRRNHLLYSKVQCLVSSQFKIYIILFEHIQEHTSEFLFLLCTSSESPCLVCYRSTSWTVEVQIKRYVCLARTSVLNHKVKFLVVSYFSKIQTEPFFACSHIHSSPIKINSFGASIIHNILCLIHFCSQRDFLICIKCQIQSCYASHQKLFHISTPRLVVFCRDGVVKFLGLCLTKSRCSHHHLYYCSLISQIGQIQGQSRIFCFVKRSQIHAIPQRRSRLMDITVSPIKVNRIGFGCTAIITNSHHADSHQ